MQHYGLTRKQDADGIAPRATWATAALSSYHARHRRYRNPKCEQGIALRNVSRVRLPGESTANASHRSHADRGGRKLAQLGRPPA